jgi:putative ubiquitin-RnfH superfamily antitoxin RatB of RatAB toxin-antitoxin module
MLIEVAYALENEAFLKSFIVDEGIEIKDVIKLSGVLEQYSKINLTINQIGIFGKVVNFDTKLRDKDRIEIYRPLIADPKEVRKRKALERKSNKKTLKSP